MKAKRSSSRALKQLRRPHLDLIGSPLLCIIPLITFLCSETRVEVMLLQLALFVWTMLRNAHHETRFQFDWWLGPVVCCTVILLPRWLWGWRLLIRPLVGILPFLPVTRGSETSRTPLFAIFSALLATALLLLAASAPF